MSDFKISLRDYQAIRKVDIIVKDGLNAIIGPNNSGKSATLRGVKEALMNKGDDDKVRAGQRYSAIKLHNGEHELIYRRDSHGKNNKTLYQLDGKSIEKVGRTQLPEVERDFKISEVKLSNNNKEEINFWDYNTMPFLTDRTGQQLFEFLSLSSCEKYLAVLKGMKKDIKELDTNISKINMTIDTLEEMNKEKKDFLDKNMGFSDLYTQTVILNEDIKKFQKIEEILIRVTNLEDRLKDRELKLESVTKRLSSIDFDKILAMRDDMGKDELEIGKLVKSLEGVNRKVKHYLTKKSELVIKTDLHKESSELLERLRGSFKDVVDTDDEVNTLFGKLVRIGNGKKRLDNAKLRLSEISLKVDDIDLESFKDELRRLEESGELLKSFAEKIGRVDITTKRYLDIEERLNNTNLLYNNKVNEFEKFKKEDCEGICPFCGSDSVCEH